MRRMNKKRGDKERVYSISFLSCCLFFFFLSQEELSHQPTANFLFPSSFHALSLTIWYSESVTGNFFNSVNSWIHDSRCSWLMGLWGLPRGGGEEDEAAAFSFAEKWKKSSFFLFPLLVFTESYFVRPEQDKRDENKEISEEIEMCMRGKRKKERKKESGRKEEICWDKRSNELLLHRRELWVLYHFFQWKPQQQQQEVGREEKKKEGGRKRTTNSHFVTKL